MEHNLLWTTPSSFKEVESSGILAGVEENGNKVFVGRSIDRDGNYVVAKVVPELNAGFFAYNDTEESVDNVEFLGDADNYHWVKSDGEKIADAAVVSGFYIGRALYNGNVVVGRVDLKTKKLIGSYGGETFSLPSYDVLIYKAKGVVHEAIQKASNFMSSTTHSQSTFSRRVIVSGKHDEPMVNGRYEETKVDESNYLKLVQKLRSLEMEKVSYLKDKQSYEFKLEFEQRKVSELSQQLKRLKVENARFSKERFNFEEKFTSEQRKYSDLELKVQEYVLNNSYLLQKVTALEDAIRYEKLLSESLATKFNNGKVYSESLLTKLTDFETTITTQQERIFEMESEIMVSSSSSESLLKKVADYEETVKHLRLQMEALVKKLEISSADNDFLLQKLAMLTATLRSYQNQIECLSNKLQSAKTVIASTHSELSRANSQVSKYQAALSSCYVLNGELMSKVSGMTSVQQVGVECSLNLVNYASDISYKSAAYKKTSTLLESGSENFLSFLQSPAGATETSHSFTPFAPEEVHQFTPYAPQEVHSFTPYAPQEVHSFTPYAPVETHPQGTEKIQAYGGVNGVSDV